MKKVPKQKKLTGRRAAALIARKSKAAGVSMKDACAMQGFSRMTINSWSRGICDPKPGSVAKIDRLVRALEILAA